MKETPEYRCMQSQFSVLYNESLQLKAHLDEARTLLHGTRTTHQRQVELIEVMPLFPQPGSSVMPPPSLLGLCACANAQEMDIPGNNQTFVVPDSDEVRYTPGSKHQVLFPFCSSEG